MFQQDFQSKLENRKFLCQFFQNYSSQPSLVSNDIRLPFSSYPLLHVRFKSENNFKAFLTPQ